MRGIIQGGQYCNVQGRQERELQYHVRAREYHAWNMGRMHAWKNDARLPYNGPMGKNAMLVDVL